MTTKAAGLEKKKKIDQRIFVVATNPEYEKICADSLKRLPSKARVELLSFSRRERSQPPKAHLQPTVVVSRLSDISRDVLKMASSRSATKQLVFLEELPVEAMATRLMPLNIRNPERIHIAAERERSGIEKLVYRVVNGLAGRDGSPLIVDAWIENDALVLLAPSFSRLRVPLAKLDRFIGNDKAKIAAYEIDEDGRFLYWPHADVHLGWAQFQRIVNPADVLTATERSERYNKRYGAAIRAIRESHGLKQSDIPGITDRQLRRLEQGQQTATKRALTALAKAHSLSLEEYVEQLAKAVCRCGRAAQKRTHV